VIDARGAPVAIEETLTTWSLAVNAFVKIGIIELFRVGTDLCDGEAVLLLRFDKNDVSSVM
jgi:hypothetical protein